ncbi:hypothetical protein HYH03_004693 [Edaphochlamys debaryana]|uniref:NlpC/P60 domain-containing protein n=1 Tax=Edaphochlamys debaryana TaxID=47281 RepID=A0A835Y687_9CHLO|nr:hypothetical protein HYH03_004693 [Edaphochlamys debaryana]|eukprot:KAG2497102.1 hypothetical protein HYH03_004693 [Edaphochlamys debaryana]
MFLELARRYIGVPYARRHHDPVACACEGCAESGRQLYHEPLFLDCCGLVRKVVRGMAAHLGFWLGPWNQAYQFDTLPVRLTDASQLRPGDLVFYSGSPRDPAAKRHAFNMTHVEIFVGGDTGEATIGSRERYKWVMEYPSYKFVSQRWDLIEYHFCSLDPWLEGLCVPQHPELWKPRSKPKQAQGQAQAQSPGRSTAGAQAQAQAQAQSPTQASRPRSTKTAGSRSSPTRTSSGGGCVGAGGGALGPPALPWDSGRYSIFGRRRPGSSGSLQQQQQQCQQSDGDG